MTVRITDITSRHAHQSLLVTHRHSEDMPPTAQQIAPEMLENKTDSNPPKKQGNIHV